MDNRDQLMKVASVLADCSFISFEDSSPELVQGKVYKTPGLSLQRRADNTREKIFLRGSERDFSKDLQDKWYEPSPLDSWILLTGRGEQAATDRLFQGLERNVRRLLDPHCINPGPPRLIEVGEEEDIESWKREISKLVAETQDI